MTTLVTTPLGGAQHLRPTTSMFPLNRAYAEGANAYILGAAESTNPHTDEALRREWVRGYCVARKHDRFAYTIRNRGK